MNKAIREVEAKEKQEARNTTSIKISFKVVASKDQVQSKGGGGKVSSSPRK